MIKKFTRSNKKSVRAMIGALTVANALVCFLFFLCIEFFYLSINKIRAAGLEVAYPAISGQTIGASSMLPDYMFYLFNAGMFLGFFAVFISLTIAGAMYFLSPAKPDLLADARDRVGGAISGLLILVLTYLILTTINPQLSVFNLNTLPPTPPTPAETKQQGVYFYESDCSDNNVQPNTSSIPDLGPLKNKINSVGIVQGADSYISILYDNTNFWGRCDYITTTQGSPNQICQSVDPFAASASIYRYDYNPNGDGVYFYRKSYFNDKGGYYKVNNSQIKDIYIHKLDNPGGLEFIGVPEEEKDCVKYDGNGRCAKNGRKTPTLGGENISSMKIRGNYLVLFTYAGPGQECSFTPWTSCQEFPTIDDVNELGPQQIKWQNIRNSGNVIPNCVVIIPIQKQ